VEEGGGRRRKEEEGGERKQGMKKDREQGERGSHTIMNINSVIPNEILVNHPVQFPECRKSGGPHPHHKIGIFKIGDDADTRGILKQEVRFFFGERLESKKKLRELLK
jgi:hypothetical protein